MFDIHTQARIAWLKSLAANPPAEIPAVTGKRVLDPAKYILSLQEDIAQGSDGPRAKHGGLQNELCALHRSLVVVPFMDEIKSIRASGGSMQQLVAIGKSVKRIDDTVETNDLQALRDQWSEAKGALRELEVTA